MILYDYDGRRLSTPKLTDLTTGKKQETPRTPGPPFPKPTDTPTIYLSESKLKRWLQGGPSAHKPPFFGSSAMTPSLLTPSPSTTMDSTTPLHWQTTPDTPHSSPNPFAFFKSKLPSPTTHPQEGLPTPHPQHGPPTPKQCDLESLVEAATLTLGSPLVRPDSFVPKLTCAETATSERREKSRQLGNARLETPGNACLETPGNACLETPGNTCLETPGNACLETPGNACLETPGNACLTRADCPSHSHVQRTNDGLRSEFQLRDAQLRESCRGGAAVAEVHSRPPLRRTHKVSHL